MPPPETKISPQLIGDILNIVHNAVFLLDSTSRIFFANSRMGEMFRKEREELLGQHIEALFMPEDRPIMVRNILTITRRDGELETEAMLHRPDGSSFLGLLACSLFRWENSHGIAITIHDISKMRSLKQMLRHSERIAFLGRMLDDISHQIRNPVSVIGGLAKRIQAGIPNPHHAEVIVKEAARLEELLDTLNRFTHLPRPYQRRIELGTLFNHAETLVKMLAEARGIEWRGACPPHLAGQSILADNDLLLMALEAIILNACEAYGSTDGNKLVQLDLIETGEREHPYGIRVKDEGSGIGQENLPHIFSHFYTKKTRHLGMGLTFAQRIIDEQKGKLTVESEPGQGTTVTIKLIGERRRDIRTQLLEP